MTDTNDLRVALLELMCITPCRDCDPCLGGRPDQCALFPALDHNLIAQARRLLADRLGHIAYLQALHPRGARRRDSVRAGKTAKGFMSRIIEPDIIINGTPLTTAQALTVRVAVQTFAMDLLHGLGDDDHGKRMEKAYADRIREVNALMQRNQS